MVKISELSAVSTAIAGTNLLPLVQREGAELVSRNVTVEDLLGADIVADTIKVGERTLAQTFMDERAANPVKRNSAIADAFVFLDIRRRRGGGLSTDGKLFDIAGVAAEYVSSTKVRLRRLLGGAAIDLNSDGTVDLNHGQIIGLAPPSVDSAAVSRGHASQMITAAVSAVPVRVQSAVTSYAFMFLDKRRRLAGGLSHDGKAFDIAGVVSEFVTSTKSRLRRKGGGASIDLNSDGSIELAGEQRVASQNSSIIRAVLGVRRRAIEVLYKDGRYIVAKAAFTPTATGFTLKGADGTPIITQDGATVTHHGAASRSVAPLPNFFPTYAVTTAAPANKRDVWRHPMGQILYSAVDKTRLANWGSSSMDNGNFGTQLSAIATKYGIATTSINGWGSDLVEHILARMGVRPALLTLPGNEIPATTDAVDITVSNMPFRENFRSTSGTLAGVPGTLRSLTGGTRYVFTRTTAGNAVAIAPDTPFIPNPGAVNRSAINLLNIGKNSVGDYTARELFDFICLAYDWQAPERPWNLVINHFVNPNGANKATILALNALTAARFGPVHVDQYSFICLGLPQFGKSVWQLLGIEPTQADIAAQALGVVPPSLSDGGVHLNDAGSYALQWLIEQIIDGLGWFS